MRGVADFRGGGSKILSLALASLLAATSLADCVEYGEYFHWIANVPVPGAYCDVAAAGNFVYALNGSFVQIYDVTDPSRPVARGVVVTPDQGRRILLRGDLAYVASWTSGLVVLDISDPDSPAVLGQFDTASYASAVAVQDGVAYIADGDDGLLVVDVTHSESMSLIGALGLPGNAIGVAVEGTYAYVMCLSRVLYVVDISSPANPQVVGTWSNNYGTPSDVAAAGDHVYAAVGPGLYVLDVTIPSAPTTADRVGVSEGTRLVRLEGSTAYVLTVGGFYIVDVSDPHDGRIITSARGSIGYRGVARSSAFVYFANTLHGLEIMDAQDLSMVRPTGAIDTPGVCSDLQTVGHHAYAADGTSGLQIIDWSSQYVR